MSVGVGVIQPVARIHLQRKQHEFDHADPTKTKASPTVSDLVSAKPNADRGVSPPEPEIYVYDDIRC